MCLLNYRVFGPYDHQVSITISPNGDVQKTIHTYLSNHLYTGQLKELQLAELQQQIDLLKSSSHPVDVQQFDQHQYFSELKLPQIHASFRWQGDVPSLPVELKQLLYLIDQIDLTRQVGAA